MAAKSKSSSDRMDPMVRRVVEIEVRNLFGFLTHSIPLSRDGRVTVLIGPNGVGKTRTLEFAAALLSGTFRVLREAPFESFSLKFDDGAVLKVTQLPPDPADEPARVVRQHRARHAKSRRPLLSPQLSVTYSKNGAPSESWNPRDRAGTLYARNTLPQLPPWVEYEEFDVWYDRQEDCTLTTGELSAAYGIDYDLIRDLEGAPKWYTDVQKTNQVRLIETQRLLREPRRRWSEHRAPRHSDKLRTSIVDVAERLAEKIQSVRGQYTRRSTDLDRTYVDRFLSSSFTAPTTLAQDLDDIARRRERLEKLDLLTTEDPAHGAGSYSNVTDEKRPALALFAADMHTKLSELEPLAKTIETYLGVVNRKLRSKTLHSSAESGLFIKSTTGAKIALQHLSSGEQHEIVMFHQLVFQTPKNSLVMIDEPELSLHPAWQEQFLDDLIGIAEAAGYDVIVATHSPYILGSRTNLCVTLGDISSR